MSFLRLAVNCAVFDDDNCVLLSQRGDLGVWNLPGGRVDSGESLAEAAAREVREETGIVAQIERPVGLYYANGWQRLTVLYIGWTLGGELLQQTAETRANKFFPPNRLPQQTFRPGMVTDALAHTRPFPHIATTPQPELQRIKWKLRWRWVKNLLQGRPEPRYTRFTVQAVAVIWDETHQRVLTLPGTRARVLPRIVCDGETAPWQQLANEIHRYFKGELVFQWVGLWQNPAGDSLELIFSATVSPIELAHGAEWSSADTAALMGLDAEYVTRIQPTYLTDDVWTMQYTFGHESVPKPIVIQAI